MHCRRKARRPSETGLAARACQESDRGRTFNAMSKLSPSTYEKLKLTQPGYPLGSPFRTTCSMRALMLLIRRSESARMRARSLCSIRRLAGWS